jgi:hypothetical protein
MVRVPSLVLLATLTALGVETSPDGPNVTFNKDVLPILQENCQSCHHPGGIALMALMTYEDARPWAKAMKAKLITRQMPPWFADSGFAKLRNAPRLTDSRAISQATNKKASSRIPFRMAPVIQAV